jgi:hypothetical protein
METKVVIKRQSKPFPIANPIYDTVFKRLMENRQIAKFFLSTILERQIEDFTVLPRGFTYKPDKTKVTDKVADKVEDKEKEEDVQYFSFFCLNSIVTVRESDGTTRKLLIELQKSWDTLDIMLFRKFLEGYIRVDIIDGKETMLPVTRIYILNNNLAGIESPCIKVGHTYIDMIKNEPITVKSIFLETLTHDSYVIQPGRITDVQYTTDLDKLLSIFEQKYFIIEGSDVRKEYPYQLDDENMELITDILYEIGANPEIRKEIESEKEVLRIINNVKAPYIKRLEEHAKLEEQAKTIAEKKEKLAELERLLQDKQPE